MTSRPGAERLTGRAAGRSIGLDAVRGAAIAAMVVYHTAWDLSQLRLIETEVTAVPAWNLFARAIAAGFLLLVGIGLELAHRDGFDQRAFLSRLGRIGLAAGAVTAATAVAFPDSYVFFGILHNIALSSLLAAPFVRAPALVPALAGLAILGLPWAAGGGAFDHPALTFLGLGTRAPNTNDFVPVVPWTGFVLLGVALGRAVPGVAGLGGAERQPLVRALAGAGRHSLAIYLIHQPVIFGALSLVAALAGPNETAVARPFLRRCELSCREAGPSAFLCERSCGCAVARLREAGLWRSVVEGRPPADRVADIAGIARACHETARAAEPATPSPR